MNIIPETVKTKFHSFCMQCPICKPEVDSSVVCVGNHKDMCESTVTCKNYDFCKSFVEAAKAGKIQV